MRTAFFYLGIAAFVTGCAGTDFARLAPPGIIRHERIAEEKEPNEAITARVSERRENQQARFPKMGETAAGAAGMTAIPNEGVAGTIERLEKERANLVMAVATDELEAAAAAAEAGEIDKASAELAAAIKNEKAAAARERREQLDSERYESNEK